MSSKCILLLPFTYYLFYLFSEKLKPHQRDFSLFTFHFSLKKLVIKTVATHLEGNVFASLSSYGDSDGIRAWNRHKVAGKEAYIEGGRTIYLGVLLRMTVAIDGIFDCIILHVSIMVEHYVVGRKDIFAIRAYEVRRLHLHCDIAMSIPRSSHTAHLEDAVRISHLIQISLNLAHHVVYSDILSADDGSIVDDALLVSAGLHVLCVVLDIEISALVLCQPLVRRQRAWVEFHGNHAIIAIEHIVWLITGDSKIGSKCTSVVIRITDTRCKA